MKSGRISAGNAWRMPSFAQLGWGFLLAWVFCMFYTDIAATIVGAVDLQGQASLSVRGMHLLLPVGSTIVVLLALIVLEKRTGLVTSHKAFVIITALCASVASPLVHVPSSLGLDDGLSGVLFIIGAVCTGAGSAVLWAIWGDYYSRLSRDEIELFAPASALLASVGIVAVSAMSGVVGAVFVAALPLASCLCFYWAKHEDRQNSRNRSVDSFSTGSQSVHETAGSQLTEQPFRALRAMGRSGWGILAACFFVCVEGGFWSAGDVTSVQAVIVVSALVMAVVGLVSIAGPRRVSVSFAFRWLCPLLVAGFASISLFGEGLGSFLAYGASIAGRFAFCVITQMYFARFVASGQATATQSYGWGWIFVHVGDALGLICLLALGDGSFAGLVFPASQVASVCVILLVVVAMCMMGDERSVAYAFEDRLEVMHPVPLRNLASAKTVSENEPTVASKKASAIAGAPVSTTVGEQKIVDVPIQDGSPQENTPQESFDEVIARLAAEFSLTPRETEVFSLLVRGRSVPYIRDELVISRDTAATHVKHIYAKAGVHSRQELIDLAIQ